MDYREDFFGLDYNELIGIEVSVDPPNTRCSVVLYDPSDGFVRDADEWAIMASAAAHDARFYCRTTTTTPISHLEYYFNPNGWHPSGVANGSST